MAVEDLKRWQWGLIGAAGGVMLALAWGGVPDQTGVRTFSDVGGRQFRAALRRTDADGEPLVQNIVVYPPTEAFEGRATVRLVTFDAKKNRDPDAERVAHAYYSPVPFPVPGGGAGGGAGGGGGDPATPKYPSVVDYLAEVAGKGPYDHVTYQTAWWCEPTTAYTVGAVGGLVLVGGVWPTVLGLMAGAGFGRPKRPEDEYDLSRFGQGEAAPAPAQPTPKVDEEELEQVMARYQSGLAGGDTAVIEGGSDSAASDADRPVRSLDASPAEPAPAARESANAPTQFGGEYYPVARTGGKPKG